jgi:hypothetical protein
LEVAEYTVFHAGHVSVNVIVVELALLTPAFQVFQTYVLVAELATLSTCTT